MQPSPAFCARYRIERELGRGASGRVVRATQSGLGRAVAVKFLDCLEPSANALARFEGEARGLAALSHPHVLRVFDYGTDESQRYIVTELASSSLGDLVNQHGPLAVPAALRAALDIVRGLEYLHERGILHRDIKPHNVFVMEDGRVVLGDFGLAASESGGVVRTTTGIIVGTPRYMAPELFEGAEFSPSTDFYALGVTIFEPTAARRSPGSSPTWSQRPAIRPDRAFWGAIRTEQVPGNALDWLWKRMLARRATRCSRLLQTPIQVEAVVG